MSGTPNEAPGRKSPDAQLAEIEKKMQQLKAKKQQIQNRISLKERKERTRRLIQVGAIFEKEFPKLAEVSLEDVSKVASELHKLLIKSREASGSEPQQR
ncbi:relaxasome subunit MobC [Paenibacillus taihuensis]|uniref:Relaxasome subunit MobC n=1 Tax=Paenibacillus taihuensis TaxID=1156355 RepID=A0A3D9Q167_9BACL|nr:DUF3847 domain-containing protein [Paenibacillus taihuensis]REE54714.1 relaxasome subunit MobC [Paenibacillus taihuensis]